MALTSLILNGNPLPKDLIRLVIALMLESDIEHTCCFEMKRRDDRACPSTHEFKRSKN